MNFNVTSCHTWLEAFSQAMIENKDHLNALDTPIGDGDHGSNMVRGMLEYRKQKEEKQPDTIADTLKLLAMAMISKVGGSSGPLYGSAFLSMSKAMSNKENITTVKEMAEILEEGLQAIQMRGKAIAGDKTMLDVWIPIVENVNENQLTEVRIHQAMDDTATLLAKKGRASYLGERSIGHIDPGAASSAILFIELLKVL